MVNVELFMPVFLKNLETLLNANNNNILYIKNHVNFF